jgi:hypothetical protein
VGGRKSANLSSVCAMGLREDPACVYPRAFVRFSAALRGGSRTTRARWLDPRPGSGISDAVMHRAFAQDLICESRLHALAIAGERAGIGVSHA